MGIKTHDYEKHAGEYAGLGIEGTHYLAFRDIPELIREYGGSARDALDYGCGAGRSTRFLKRLGLETVGVDVSPDMLEQARSQDNSGEYRLITGGKLPFEEASFDIVFSSFVFLEVARLQEVEAILTEMKRVLRKNGIIVFVTSSLEAPTGSWVSYSYAFPENTKLLHSGDTVKLLIKGTNVILYDYYWTEEDYQRVTEGAGLTMVRLHKPLGSQHDSIDWLDETEKPPYAVYVLRKDPNRPSL